MESSSSSSYTVETKNTAGNAPSSWKFTATCAEGYKNLQSSP